MADGQDWRGRESEHGVGARRSYPRKSARLLRSTFTTPLSGAGAGRARYIKPASQPASINQPSAAALLRSVRPPPPSAARRAPTVLAIDAEPLVVVGRRFVVDVRSETERDVRLVLLRARTRDERTRAKPKPSQQGIGSCGRPRRSDEEVEVEAFCKCARGGRVVGRLCICAIYRGVVAMLPLQVAAAVYMYKGGEQQQQQQRVFGEVRELLFVERRGVGRS